VTQAGHSVESHLQAESAPGRYFIRARLCAAAAPGCGSLSTEKAIDFWQELGEVELCRASGTGGVEIGAVPVSLFLGELGVGFARPAAGAMMLVGNPSPAKDSWRS
jgi:hypothetical protein